MIQNYTLELIEEHNVVSIDKEILGNLNFKRNEEK